MKDEELWLLCIEAEKRKKAEAPKSRNEDRPYEDRFWIEFYEQQKNLK